VLALDTMIVSEFRVDIVRNAIDEEYCQRLIAEMSQHLTAALLWSKGKRVHDPARREAYNYKWRDSGLAEVTRTIISRFSGYEFDPVRIEPMEIVCYPPGNGFEPHFDGPHRSHSIVYFLNHGYEGGELVFDDGKIFRDMPVGSAVVWENSERALHACQPITRGFKWIIATWARHPDALGGDPFINARIREANEEAGAPFPPARSS
jgi:predicted 2-oxoglutarate/Fe(II)-dependent dioxygenase YbiX